MASVQRAVLLLCVLAASARAGVGATVIEAHGVEIEVPAGWSVTTKKSSTTIMPAKRTGRGIDVIEANAPLTVDFVTQVMKAAKMSGGDVREGTRNGAKVIAVQGKVPVAGGATVDVEMLAIENAARHTVLLTSYVKSDADPVLRDANEKLLLSARLAGPKMTFVYKKAHTKDLAGYPADVVKLLGAMGPTLDKLFRFPRPLPIVVDECGTVNAFYSPSDHSITMCHELWDDTFALFRMAGADVPTATKLTRGTVMFAFFHEFGHALVGELGLPITGKGEDAADEIATIFLGQAKEFGRDSALGAARWFAVMAAAPNHKNVFYDEHSFDEQRVVSIACLLYGSDSKQYEPLMIKLNIPSPRRARCIRDYRDRSKAWSSLIEPHMRKVSSR